MTYNNKKEKEINNSVLFYLFLSFFKNNKNKKVEV